MLMPVWVCALGCTDQCPGEGSTDAGGQALQVQRRAGHGRPS